MGRHEEQLATPHLVTSGLLAFEELPVEEFRSRNWGYTPLVSTVITEDGLLTNRCRVYNELLFWNFKTKKRFPWPIVVTTLDKARLEGKRLKCGPDFVLTKHLQFSFTLRNENPLPIRNMRVRISLVDKNNTPVASAFDNATHMVSEFTGKQESVAIFDVFFELEPELPDEMLFRIVIDYDFRGKEQPSKVLSVLYRTTDNSWSVGM